MCRGSGAMSRRFRVQVFELLQVACIILGDYGLRVSGSPQAPLYSAPQHRKSQGRRWTKNPRGPKYLHE